MENKFRIMITLWIYSLQWPADIMRITEALKGKCLNEKI